MSTASSVDLFLVLRTRILTFVTPDGDSPGDQLGTDPGGRVFYAQAPDDVTTPYAIARFINRQVTQQGTRERVDLELMLFDRPRSRQAIAEELADWIKGALIGYRNGSTAPRSSGLVMVNPPSGDTMPQTPSPGDADLVCIRILAEVISYPRYLTQYSIPGS